MARVLGCLLAALLSTAVAGQTPPDPAAAPKAEAPSEPAKAAYDRGLAAKKAKALDDAATAFRDAIKQTAGYLDAHYALAWVLLAKGDPQAAAAEFRRVVALAPESPQATESKNALERLKLPLAPAPTPGPPTPPPPPAPVQPTPAPATPTAPAAPVAPAAKPPVTPGDPDWVMLPKDPQPAKDLNRLNTRELWQRCLDTAAAAAKAGATDVALALYRHLLVFDPNNAALAAALEKTRGDAIERHDLVTPESRLAARDLLAKLRPVEDFGAWPKFEPLLMGAELRLLLDPRVVGNAVYGRLRYPGCDPLTPLVLFVTPPNLTASEIKQAAGPPQTEAKTWDKNFTMLTWGHLRALADDDGKVVAVVRLMGNPTPPEPPAR
jgi:tetratricopeptide (TPR) repeat protein